MEELGLWGVRVVGGLALPLSPALASHLGAQFRATPGEVHYQQRLGLGRSVTDSKPI